MVSLFADSNTCASAFTLLGYIDPGTGSMLFQVLAATLISAGLFFKGARDRLMMTFYAVFRARHEDAKPGEPKPSEPG